MYRALRHAAAGGRAGEQVQREEIMLLSSPWGITVRRAAAVKSVECLCLNSFEAADWRFLLVSEIFSPCSHSAEPTLTCTRSDGGFLSLTAPVHAGRFKVKEESKQREDPQDRRERGESKCKDRR